MDQPRTPGRSSRRSTRPTLAAVDGNCEFTYPLFDSHEVGGDWDPFPYVTWEMDVAVGNRNR